MFRNLRCRTCLNENHETIPLHNPISITEYGAVLTIVELVKECASVEIAVGDSKPQTICKVCVGNAKTSFLFRKKCQESHAILNQEYIKIEKIEVEVDDSFFHDDNDRKDVFDDIFSSDDEKPLSTISKRKRYYAAESHPCDKCGKSYKSLKHLTAHVRRHAVPPKSLRCDLCNKMFKTKDSLFCHQRRHDEKYARAARQKLDEREAQRPLNERTCDVCHKHFKYRKNMLSHKVRTHINKVGPIRERDRPVEERTCTVCGKTYMNRRDMLKHKRRSHGDAEAETLADQPVPEGSSENGMSYCMYCHWRGTPGRLAKHKMTEHSHLKRFKCSLCTKMFFTSEKLKRHMLVHTGEKNHMCEVCGTRFAVKEYLDIHKRTHTGERPYKCDKCDKTFTQSASLLLHGYTHSKDTTFVCSHCGKTFFRQATLRLHLKKHQTTPHYNQQCHLCDKRLVDKQYVQSRPMGPQGERNPICFECDKAFGLSPLSDRSAI